MQQCPLARPLKATRPPGSRPASASSAPDRGSESHATVTAPPAASLYAPPLRNAALRLCWRHRRVGICHCGPVSPAGGNGGDRAPRPQSALGAYDWIEVSPRRSAMATGSRRRLGATAVPLDRRAGEQALRTGTPPIPSSANPPRPAHPPCDRPARPRLLADPLPPGIAGDPGLFGPGSQVWQIWRERLLLLGGPAAVLLQLAHPLIAAAVAAHSSFQDDPLGRLRAVLNITLTVVFGDRQQALAAATRVGEVHWRVQGRLPGRLRVLSCRKPLPGQRPAACPVGTRHPGHGRPGGGRPVRQPARQPAARRLLPAKQTLRQAVWRHRPAPARRLRRLPGPPAAHAARTRACRRPDGARACRRRSGWLARPHPAASAGRSWGTTPCPPWN